DRDQGFTSSTTNIWPLLRTVQPPDSKCSKKQRILFESGLLSYPFSTSIWPVPSALDDQEASFSGRPLPSALDEQEDDRSTTRFKNIRESHP
ncbi:3168_t:CDS:2, partial [Ambispora gerdemannii]